MNRRKFLEGAAQLTLGVLAATAFPVPVAAEEKPLVLAGEHRQLLYRGTQDGRIMRYTAENGCWETCATFNPNCKVLRVFRRGEWLYARLSFKGHEFMLKSRDGQLWYS